MLSPTSPVWDRWGLPWDLQLGGAFNKLTLLLIPCDITQANPLPFPPQHMRGFDHGLGI